MGYMRRMKGMGNKMANMRRGFGDVRIRPRIEDSMAVTPEQAEATIAEAARRAIKRSEGLVLTRFQPERDESKTDAAHA